MSRLRPALALALALSLAWASSSAADEVRVAVAANFREPCEALARQFEAEAGHRVVLTVGSTGSLFAQLRAGAPCDVFLAADARRPLALEREGRARRRFTYARGRLVLVGRGLRADRDGVATLREGAFQHLALANPEAAPYGAAAREALTRLEVWAALEPKLVLGESVAQAHQFVVSGGAELGLVALAQVKDEPRWLVPAELHAPIDQDAALLSDAPAARAFCDFLESPPARARIQAMGYAAFDAPRAPPASGPQAREPTPESSERAPASAWPAIRVTLALALTSTAVLLLLGTPLAWWLARGEGRLRLVVEATVALPLVLPPTVLGFYLLVLLGPQGPIGAAWEALGGPRLVFSFLGLVVGSVVYSLPFVVQPLRNSFRAIEPTLLEAAATLGASPWDRWRSVVFPLARPGFLTAAVLGFAHTVGEFGVVLMLGGSVPGRTKVLSIAIYEHVEQLHYAQAHVLAGGMLAFSFCTLLLVHAFGRRLERVAP